MTIRTKFVTIKCQELLKEFISKGENVLYIIDIKKPLVERYIIEKVIEEFKRSTIAKIHRNIIEFKNGAKIFIADIDDKYTMQATTVKNIISDNVEDLSVYGERARTFKDAVIIRVLKS